MFRLIHLVLLSFGIGLIVSIVNWMNLTTEVFQRLAFEGDSRIFSSHQTQMSRAISCDAARDVLHAVPDVMLLPNVTERPSRARSCADYISGNITDDEHLTLLTWMQTMPIRRHTLQDIRHSTKTSNCKDYVAKIGYNVSAIDGDERQFPIAYNILMYKDVEQLERLLKAIYRRHNSYCIHVDAKSPVSLHLAVRSLAACLPHVFVASVLENVTYAGFSRLKADINCMRDHVASDVTWKYLINLASQAFPIKTNSEIVAILKAFGGANDVEGIFGKRLVKSRFESAWREVNGSVKPTGSRNPAPPHDIQIIRGSAYATFSRAFVEFILADRKAKDLLEWSRSTLTPDEHYWATLHHLYSNPHLHTPGGYSGVPDEKPWLSSYSAWSGEYRCRGEWLRAVCVFGVADLPHIINRRELFINKVSLDVQPLAMECLDRWIQYKSACSSHLDLDFYKRLPFVKRNL